MSSRPIVRETYITDREALKRLRAYFKGKGIKCSDNFSREFQPGNHKGRPRN